MKDSKILVSICCITYNHAQYIRQCLDGFLMQETNFAFEILIHDDASTDGTADIIREYEKKYPNVIKPIYQEENQYSKGVNITEKYNWSRVKGKYVAQCEGDDYWIDSQKLQRQVDFMEANLEYNLSAENALVQHINGQSWEFSSKPTRDVTTTELLTQRQFPTASVLFKANLLTAINRFEGPKFDTFTWTYMSQNGKIHYSNIVSSVYRRGGGITEADKVRWAYLVETYNQNMYDKLNIPKHIIKERNKTQVGDCYNGYLAARKQGRYNVAFDLLLKCFRYDMFFFITFYIFGENCYNNYITFKRSVKSVFKKMLKCLRLWD